MISFPTRRVGVVLAGAALLGVVAACTTATTPTGTATSTPSTQTASASPSVDSPPATPPPSRTPTAPLASPKSQPPSPAPDPEALTIAITIADGQVEPNGETLEARAGQRVVLRVTSDIDDEIHAHTSGDGFELSVAAGETATGDFLAGEPGSYEIESHGLGKTIVILNVR